MIQHEATIHLNCPIEQVFAFLVDVRNLPTWQSSLIKNELLTDGPVRVGTRFREVRQMGPRQSEVQGEITNFKPNKHFATKTLTKPLVTVSYTLAAEDGGTRLTYTFVMLTSGFMRLLEPLIAGSIKKDTNSDFETLKRVLEG